MKKFICLMAALSVIVPSLCVDADACTNLIVGKKASADGSVICSYNCDGYGFCGHLTLTAGGWHDKGEMVAIHSWGDGPIVGYIPQVERTYSVAGYINEKQVSIVETTFDGRLDLVNPDGWLDYFTMMKFGLERASTAREAIKVMTDLVDQYGYNATGETITICDKEEAWIMEIIGKGPGRKGAVWVAIRIPDDCICAHANLSRIRQFPLKDKENCMYAKDVISFAREMGYFSGKDEDFSFRDAYCPIDFENVRYADSRVYSFFRHHYDKDEMDKYLPYINGNFAECDHLPLYIKPDKPVSVRDIQHDMRDHYEGTPLDMTADMSSGPYGMPVRPNPMSWKASNGKTYFIERPIGTQKTAFTLVAQMRDYLPDEVGGVMYFNCDDANMVAYVPVYCCVTKCPDAFNPKYSNYQVFDERGAFWMCNFVSNMVYPRYSVIIPDLREAQDELEDYYAADQDSVIAAVKDLTKLDRINYLNNKTAEYTQKMMTRWDKLARLIIVKHNDLVMQDSKDGFATGGGTYRGYDQKFYDQIVEDTGDRYLMKVPIERRER